jgi:hypothetical protein
LRGDDIYSDDAPVGFGAFYCDLQVLLVIVFSIEDRRYLGRTYLTPASWRISLE